MRTIGLIGGMSWESTAVYYRELNTRVRAERGGLHSAEILMHSLDFARVAGLQQAGNWDGAATLLADAAEGLVRSGADGVLICTNTMHLVADTVAARIAATRPDARLLNIIDATAQALLRDERRRPVLIATRYTMEHGFYADAMRAHGIEIMLPDAAERLAVHDIIFNELCLGKILSLSRERLLTLITRAMAAGADSVILGCTEIGLLLDPDALPCPGYDSTVIHVAAAIDFAAGRA